MTEVLSSREPQGSGAWRVPDFFIVGLPKCGTTAMYEILRRHPQIFMPEKKEPNYLARELNWRFSETDPWVPLDLPSYLALFSPAGLSQLAGEASTTYFCSPIASNQIAGLNPCARLIAVVREPVALLCSLHLDYRRERIETVRTLRRALDLEPMRRTGRRIPNSPYPPEFLFYSNYVRYVEHLRRFEATLSREQMLVIVYDDFRADNAGTIATVLRFLGVDDTWPVPAVTANRSERIRSQMLQRTVETVQFGQGPLSHTLKAAIPRPLRTRVRDGLCGHLLYGSPRPLPPRLTRQLKARFRPRVAELGEYLQRDLLRLWGYEGV